MNLRVDLVVVGLTPAGESAVIDAARRGRRVLVVDRSSSRARRRRLRRALTAAGRGLQPQVSVVLGVEVVCVAGVGAVEAIVLRRVGTGRLIAVNTANLLDMITGADIDQRAMGSVHQQAQRPFVRLAVEVPGQDSVKRRVGR